MHWLIGIAASFSLLAHGFGPFLYLNLKNIPHNAPTDCQTLLVSQRGNDADLMEAIARTNEDTPRLARADVKDENSESVVADFIRHSVGLATYFPADSPTAWELDRDLHAEALDRFAAFPNFEVMARRWLVGLRRLGVWEVVLHRGEVFGIAIRAKDLIANFDRIRELAPAIRHVTLFRTKESDLMAIAEQASAFPLESLEWEIGRGESYSKGFRLQSLFDKIPRLTHLGIRGSGLSESLLDGLRNTDLKGLSIEFTEANPFDFEAIAKMSQLESVRIQCAVPISEVGDFITRSPQLRRLSLGGRCLTREVLGQVRWPTGLRILAIESREEAIPMPVGFDRLEELRWLSMSRVEVDGTSPLTKMKRLTRLDLPMARFYPDTFADLARLQHLRALSLTNASFLGAGDREFQKMGDLELWYLDLNFVFADHETQFRQSQGALRSVETRPAAPRPKLLPRMMAAWNLDWTMR